MNSTLVIIKTEDSMIKVELHMLDRRDQDTLLIECKTIKKKNIIKMNIFRYEL